MRPDGRESPTEVELAEPLPEPCFAYDRPDGFIPCREREGADARQVRRQRDEQRPIAANCGSTQVERPQVGEVRRLGQGPPRGRPGVHPSQDEASEVLQSWAPAQDLHAFVTKPNVAKGEV